MNHPNRANALTAFEIEAVLKVLEDADLASVFDCVPNGVSKIAAIHHGIRKLRGRLARLREGRE